METKKAIDKKSYRPDKKWLTKIRSVFETKIRSVFL